jgi:uncharacterized protein with HEPN domain
MDRGRSDDLQLVWDVIEHELPALKAVVDRLLADPRPMLQ